MIHFENILFPVDFSARCLEMAPYVAAVAKKFNSVLTVLHIFDAYDAFGWGSLSSTTAYTTDAFELQQRYQNEISRFAESAFSGVRLSRVLEFGKPGPEIIRYTFQHKVDLVLMPTHGYGGFKRLLLGSATGAVLHEAHCPVWTGTHTEQFCLSCSRTIAQIVCGVDLSSNSTALARTACELGNQYGATVRLVHAVGSDILGDDAPFQRFLRDTAKQRIANLQLAAQTHLETYIWPGATAEVMRQAALEAGAQLMIIGRGHARSFLGGLRTDVNDIIRESPCPVLCI
ncbi:MAG: universal stress protein [Bryobacteraceae bacterium]